MTSDELAEIVTRLRAGAELTVRNQDGWWGLRGDAEGIVEWSRSPFAEALSDRRVSDEEVGLMIGDWDFGDVVARLQSWTRPQP